jgi:undecaprenyl-diphosphatase
MHLIPLLKALVLGVIEGLTEFLPVSSTGHLILVADLLRFNDDKGRVFEIVIQAAAVLAVCWEYRRKLARVVGGLTTERKARRFVLNLAIAFVPLAAFGLLLGKAITAHLFNWVTVSTAFVAGGLVILWAEGRDHQVRVESTDELSPLDAFKLGVAQVFALIPGTSRSGATIIGGLLIGLSRRAATEFSFFLAIPTLITASVYQLYRERHLLAADDVFVFVVGAAAAFGAAFWAVRRLLRYIGAHDFRVFAWYRIAFGLAVIATWYLGLVDWSSP